MYVKDNEKKVQKKKKNNKHDIIFSDFPEQINTTTCMVYWCILLMVAGKPA